MRDATQAIDTGRAAMAPAGPATSGRAPAAPAAPPREARDEKATHEGRMLTLEICFLGLIGLLVVGAFLQATTYALVSARTPFVIMVPLFLLIVVQARRLWALRHAARLSETLADLAAGRLASFNKVLRFCGWMAGLMAAIILLGHYAGLLLFCFATMRLAARERLGLAVAVAIGATAVLYLVFEYGFNVELYRGLIPRWFMGYRDF